MTTLTMCLRLSLCFTRASVSSSAVGRTFAARKTFTSYKRTQYWECSMLLTILSLNARSYGFVSLEEYLPLVWIKWRRNKWTRRARITEEWCARFFGYMCCVNGLYEWKQTEEIVKMTATKKTWIKIWVRQEHFVIGLSLLTMLYPYL